MPRIKDKELYERLRGAGASNEDLDTGCGQYRQGRPQEGRQTRRQGVILR